MRYEGGVMLQNNKREDKSQSGKLKKTKNEQLDLKAARF